MSNTGPHQRIKSSRYQAIDPAGYHLTNLLMQAKW